MRLKLVALSLLCAVTVYGQGSQTPIYNGVLQSDLDAAGFKVLSSNMADYAGTGMSWNAVTGKFDVTAGAGSGTVTSLTATYPIVVAPTPLVTTGVISLHPVQIGIWDQASLDSMKWDGGATGLVAATGRTSLGLGTAAQSNTTAFEVPLTFSQSVARATNTVTLSGDSASPGNSQYYGTNSGGTKGWFALPAGGSGTVTSTGTAGNLAKFTTTTNIGNAVAGTDYQAAGALVTAGDLSPLFTTAESAGNVAFTLSTAAANTVFGNATASTAAPTFSSSPRFTAIGNLTTNGFVKTGGAVGTLSVDTATYQPADADLDAWALKTAYAGTLTITTGKTVNITNTLTFSGTDSSTLNIGGGGTLGTAAYTASTAYQTADSDLTTWAGITPVAAVGTWIATPSSANLRLAMTDENGTGALLFSGATTPDFTTGFTVGAAAASRKILVGNATNFVPSTETWAVPGASTNNVLKSDGTNWTAAQLAFSNLSGSATAAQMPAFTGDVTSSAGTSANTLVNIPLTTTIAGAAGARGDVLYYGATGWAKLAAGTNGNQLTTHAAGADPTWDAPGSGGSGTPGGSTTQVQFNDAGAFGGDANMVWDKAVGKLTLAGSSTTNSRLVVGTMEFQPYAINNCWFGDNVYYDGAGFKYRAAGKAGQFYFFGDEGQFRFGTTGAAGGAFSGFANLKVNYLGQFAVGNQVAGANADFTSSYLYLKPATPALQLANNFGYAWSSTTDAAGTLDTGLSRNAAGVVEVNNGTAGTYRDLKADELNAVTGFQVNGAAPNNYELTGNGTDFVGKASDIPNGSSAQQTGFASNTYLAGSVITLSAGDFKVGSTYRCMFDMAKTTAGTAAPVITIYIGTAGTTSDTAAQTITFAVATGVADTGMFEVWVNFRAVGASASISSVGRCIHNLAATGLTSTGASGSGTVSNSTSSTFNSTAMTKIGCAFNGGASYVGTNNIVQAYYSNP